MSTLTENLKLIKPNADEFYNVDVQNENMDKIDVFCSRKDNPHEVTKEQIGLGNVSNVSTNDQTPTYTVATNNENLVSGEKLNTAFGKIAKAVSSLISHLTDTTKHITNAERISWNAKANASDYLPLSGGTVNGRVLFTSEKGSGEDEGGEIYLGKPLATLFENDIAIDAYRDSARIFAQHDGMSKIFNIDFTSLKQNINYALHTGNSVRTVISDTEPTDTTILWVDSVNMKIKIYKGGVWAELT